MIRQKFVFDDKFKEDIIKAIEQDKYEITNIFTDRGCDSVEKEVKGFAATENHGSVEFSFKTERMLKLNERYRRLGDSDASDKMIWEW